MPDEPSENRREDRRSPEVAYDGPERRIAERRLPRGPLPLPDIASLSDIDLVRAARRLNGGTDTRTAELVRAEVDRRGLID